MKHFITTCFLLLILMPPGSLKAQPVVSTSLLQSLEDKKSPEQIVKWLKQNFQFREDSISGFEDYWQSPEEFWETRQGDCEDYALLAQYALSQSGITSYVISIYGSDGYSHTIVVFEKNNRYHVISNDELHYFNARSVEDAISWLAPNWIWAATAQRSGTRGRSVRFLFR